MFDVGKFEICFPYNWYQDDKSELIECKLPLWMLLTFQRPQAWAWQVALTRFTQSTSHSVAEE